MSQNEGSEDLATIALQMLLGAGEAIMLKVGYLDGREFGLSLEDLANSVDARLDLRCLLPLPGLTRERDGSVHRSSFPDQSELGSLKESLAALEDAGWQTRLIPDRPLASSLGVDTDSVIYYEYLNERPGPLFSSSPRDVAHYADQFENAWATSFSPLEIETLYDEALSLPRPVEDGRIAIVSHQAWAALIERLSRDPGLLHKLPPRKFEELIAELLSRDGLEVHLTPKTRDRGRDVLAFHETPIGRLLYLVECKRHLPNHPVGIAIVQRLYGVVSQERATAGLVVTTSRFSKDALTFAETVKHQLRLKDYEAVKEWLVRHGRT